MKYIVFERLVAGNVTHLIPIVFPLILIHSQMAHSMPDDAVYKPIAAGFYDPETHTCFGRSESLNVDSRGSLDTQLILHWAKEGKV